MRGVYSLLVVLAVVSFLFSVSLVSGQVTHSADEISGGTFQLGTYDFSGSTVNFDTLNLDTLNANTFRITSETTPVINISQPTVTQEKIGLHVLSGYDKKYNSKLIGIKGESFMGVYGKGWDLPYASIGVKGEGYRGVWGVASSSNNGAIAILGNAWTDNDYAGVFVGGQGVKVYGKTSASEYCFNTLNGERDCITTWPEVTGGGSGDNLGNHIATQNLQMRGKWISNDADLNEGIFITSGGRVGIGSGSPQADFEVKGSFSDNLLRVVTSTGREVFLARANSIGPTVGIGTTDPEGVFEVSHDGGTTHDLVVGTHGMVGINIPGDAYLTDWLEIDVPSTGSGGLTIERGSDLVATLGTAPGGDSHGELMLMDDDGYHYTVLIRGTGSSMFSGGDVQFGEDVFIYPNGRLGIGTFNPESTVHIIKDGGDKGIVLERAIGSAGNNAPFVLWDSNNGYAFGIRQEGDSLAFNRYTNINPFAGVQKLMTIKQNGNVGIGTESPSEKLEVVGNVKVSGKIYGWNVPSEMKTTISKHDGNFQGYYQMNQWVQSQGCSGYHVCDATEVTRYLQTHVLPSSLVSASEGYWYNSGIAMIELPGDQVVSHDCGGWTWASQSAHGPALLVVSSGSSITGHPSNLACNVQRKVLCCK